MSAIKYCRMRCGNCPTCPVCGIKGNSLYTPNCEGCKQCVEDHLEAMSSEERRELAIKIFLYRKKPGKGMSQEELDELISAIREEIMAEMELLSDK